MIEIFGGVIGGRITGYTCRPFGRRLQQCLLRDDRRNRGSPSFVWSYCTEIEELQLKQLSREK